MNNFQRECQNIGREGIDKLLNWIHRTDFNIAPASTVFHGNFTGGLAEHSYNVYVELKKLADFYCPGKYSEETLRIVALFHDICKADFYITSTRNVKNEKTGQWEKKPFYKKEEKEPFGGHGSKSVFLIMQYMKLSFEEASAINCHMGAWDKSEYADPGAVYEKNELAWMLHIADERATYFVDVKEEV